MNTILRVKKRRKGGKFEQGDGREEHTNSSKSLNKIIRTIPMILFTTQQLIALSVTCSYQGIVDSACGILCYGHELLAEVVVEAIAGFGDGAGDDGAGMVVGHLCLDGFGGG